MYVLLENQKSMGRLVILDTSDYVVETWKADKVLCLMSRKHLNIEGITLREGLDFTAVEKPVPVRKSRVKVGTPVITRIEVVTVEYASSVKLTGYLYGMDESFSQILKGRESKVVYDNKVKGDFYLSTELFVTVDNRYREMYESHHFRHGVYDFSDAYISTNSEGVISYHTNIGDEVNFLSLGDFLVKHLSKGVVEL